MFSKAQDLVCIKPETAKYFLEVDDEVRARRKQNLLDSTLIEHQQKELKLKNKVIQSYREDSVVYNNEIVTLDSVITLKNTELESTTRQLKNKTLLANIGIGTGLGAIVGSAIPGIGTVLGGVVGAGTGLIITIFKRKK